MKSTIDYLESLHSWLEATDMSVISVRAELILRLQINFNSFQDPLILLPGLLISTLNSIKTEIGKIFK